VLPDYAVQTTTMRLGSGDFRVRALADKQQFSDPDGASARVGFTSGNWALFGVVWPAGRVMAEWMVDFPVAGKRILEVGCGLGLASLVLQRRGADVTACDLHPLAGAFLRHNTDINDLSPITFHQAGWADLCPELGSFDLIIGSDLLYEQGHPALLAGFLALHALPVAQVLLTDPGRDRCGQLGRRLVSQGYARTDTHMAFAPGELAPHKGRLMSFVRAVALA
jgi:predicted nicotinamide N-methyase